MCALMLAGCTQISGSPVAPPSASLEMSPAEQAAASVHESMQNKLDTDPDLSRLQLTVVDVMLVNKSGNEFKGIATVKTPKGTERDVPVDVTADRDNVLWEAPPGAFLFAAQEQLDSPPPAAAPAPSSGATILHPARGGMVYIVTKSGKTRCQISAAEVACQSPFVNPPYVNGHPANGMVFGSGGSLEYVSGDLGDLPVVPIEYASYRALSWRIDATSDGTTFTHTSSGRSVFVSVTSVRVN